MTEPLPQALKAWLSAEPARVISRSPHRTQVTLIDFRDGTRASRRERTFACVDAAAQAAALELRPEDKRAHAGAYRVLGEAACDLSGATPMPVRF